MILTTADDPRARFAERICPEPNSGCHLWMGAVNRHNGYGYFWMGQPRRFLLAHRVAWLLSEEHLSDEMDVLHSCDVPSCVNPRHLFIGTALDNMNDMALKNRGKKSARGLPFGVRIDRLRYSAQVSFGGAYRHLGMFDTIEEAAHVAKEFKNRNRKAFANRSGAKVGE